MPRTFTHTSWDTINAQRESGRKVCKRCAFEKPLDEFQKGPRFRDGLQPWCKDCHCEVRAERYTRTRARVLEQNRAWEKRNPERRRLLNVVKAHKRRSRVALADGSASADQILARRAFWGNRCWMCGGEEAAEMDHVIPLAKGGSNWPANLRPVCRSCNASKRDSWKGVNQLCQ